MYKERERKKETLDTLAGLVNMYKLNRVMSLLHMHIYHNNKFIAWQHVATEWHVDKWTWKWC